MNEDVLREFLVSLGFVVEESSFKKFNLAVESVTKGVMQAGLAVAATAAGIVAGVKVISSQMENLYYASQRTGATVGNLMALRYAAGQIGLTADQAQSSLEGFTRTLRLNPGTDNLLSSLGVTGKDPTEKFDSFIDKMKGMQPYVAAAYAGLFGIDPDTLLMLENGLPKLEAEQKKYTESLKAWGIDPAQAAASGVDFNNAIRRVTSDFDKLWIVIESKLVPVLTPLIDRFEKWGETHAGDVASAIADAVQRLANWLNNIDWDKTTSEIDKVVDALGGVKGILLGLVGIKLAGVALEIAGLAGALGKLGEAGSAVGGAGLVGLLGRLSGYGLLGYGAYEAIKTMADNTPGGHFVPRNGGARPTGGVGGSDWSATWENIKKAFNYGGTGHFVSRADTNAHGSTSGTTYDALPSPSVPASPSRAATSSGSNSVDSAALFSSLEDKFGLPKGLLDSDWYAESSRGRNMRSPKGAKGHFGFMDDTAKEYGLADPNDLQQSAQAAAHKFSDLMNHYAGDLTKAIAGYNWGEGNLDKDISRFGADWAQHLPQETFDYVNRVTNGMGGARLGVNGTNSNRSVAVTQTNTFHIAGTSDPQGTARAVAGEQYRIYGDLVRNFAGAVR
ncbi:transglycosylase SLT domain-containing protein [Paraburkholderia sp. BCC1885]|uniref:transglycosylase SLT domain-containing protein n=1 Tax=Paraburkholderia sp. BCC1885 TaxID=2562669 RepID=UPI00118226BD|nr:transglycosylase SLT domain-containing protein [Paraburkholderia sp. BCC1885]